MRQVPDNQEVFVSNLDESSIIIEILELIQQKDSNAINHKNQRNNNLNDIISIHLDNLAKENESQYKNVFFLNDLISNYDQSSLFNNAIVAGLSAIMIDSNTQIPIVMILIRLPSVSTDILISINNSKMGEDIGRSLISSFKIVDWNLFKND